MLFLRITFPGYLVLLLLGCFPTTIFSQSATSDSIPAAVNDTISTVAEADLPFGAATSYLLGTTLLESGENQDAVPYLHHAYRLAPGVPEIAEAYLTVLLRQGYGHQALEVLDALIQANPDDPEHRRSYINLLAEMQRYRQALAEIETVRRDGLPLQELLILEAGLLAQTGQTQPALKAYRHALTQLPEQREQIYLLMATVLEQDGADQALRNLLGEAVAAVPHSFTLRFRLLRDLVLRGEITDAVAMAIRADSLAAVADNTVAASGDLPDVSWELELIELLTNHGDIQSAIDRLESRSQRGVNDLESTLWLARLLMRQDDWPRTIEMLRAAVDHWPDQPETHFYLGDTLAAQGDLAAGETSLREAVRLAPARAEYALSLLRLLAVRYGDSFNPQAEDSIKSAQREEMAELATRTVDITDSENGAGYMLLGYVFRSLGELDRAAELFNVAAQQESVRKEAMQQLALCQADRGNTGQARQTLELLWQEDPNDPDLANSLGYFLAERNEELERAERLIRQALASDPDNGAYLDSLGWVFFKQARYEEAFDQLVKATNAIPEDPVILEHLGLVLGRIDQPEEALRLLRRALALGGDAERLGAAIEEIEPTDDSR
ncbi:MAG: tetratricopeptide repeat protein [bacterium]